MLYHKNQLLFKSYELGKLHTVQDLYRILICLLTTSKTNIRILNLPSHLGWSSCLRTKFENENGFTLESELSPLGWSAIFNFNQIYRIKK